MNKIARIILHIDMNAFFASCEIAQNEELRGKPIVVAHNDNLDRGLITSPSYEARALGIKTTMHVAQAKRICPTIIVCEPSYDLYKECSDNFYHYLLKITPRVEMASIDEAYVDLTHLNLGEKVIDLAKKIQNDLLKLYKLPCSIGIAPNKLLAKMGSDYKKPLGITIIRKRDVPKMIWPLPIEDMLYIGKKTAPRLREIGINTIGDLANFTDIELLRRKFGESFCSTMIPKCHGIDDSEVSTEEQVASSVSAAHTFMNEVLDLKTLHDTLKVLVNTVSYRLQESKQLTGNVGIQLRFNNFQTINRSKQLTRPTTDDHILYETTKDILDDYFTEGTEVRLIGVFCNRLVEDTSVPMQISIFDNLDEIEKEQRITKLIEEINKEYGKNAIKKGI